MNIDNPEDRRRVFDIAIEGIWLTVLALVPLAFSGRDVFVFFAQPKDLILHLAALLIVALWAFDWALGTWPPGVNLSSISAIRNWPGRNPRNWALLAAAGFSVSAVISTLLSPLPWVSLWGRDFAQLGYELYSVLSFLVIFFAIALRVRNENQLRRILWTLAIAGALASLYGISQRNGWDPVGNGADQFLALVPRLGALRSP